MSPTKEQFIAACNYPGLLDEMAVESHLANYLEALGVKRKVVRLRAGWELEEYPALARYTKAVLAHWMTRNPQERDALAAQAAQDAQDALAALDAQAAQDARAARAAQDAQDALAARNARAAQDAQAALDALDARDAQAAQDARAARAAEAARAALDARDARAAQEALDARDAQDARAALDAQAARAAQDARAALDARAAQDAQDARDARNARAALDAQAALDALDARDAQAAQDARAARAALAARAAQDALDARDALAALDARGSLRRFAAWCIQAHGWRWYRFDVSWVATTAFGARQLRAGTVSAWAEPLLEAFIAGCWILHWTDDTLYWVSKPTIHMDPAPNTRRLHHAERAAMESDVENLYFWHGVLVPAFVVVKPEWITVKHIEDETNAEVRRVMMERYGYPRYIRDCGAKIVHSLPSDFAMVGLRDARLLVKEVADDEPIVYVDLLNSTPEPDGTTKRYMLRVDPNAYDGAASRDCLAAVASTWRTKDGKLVFKHPRDYQPVFES